MDRPTCATCPYWQCGWRNSEIVKARNLRITGMGARYIARRLGVKTSQVTEWLAQPSPTGMCIRYPANVEKAYLDACGEHPLFQAFIESQKSNSPTATPSVPPSPRE